MNIYKINSPLPPLYNSLERPSLIPIDHKPGLARSWKYPLFCMTMVSVYCSFFIVFKFNWSMLIGLLFKSRH